MHCMGPGGVDLPNDDNGGHGGPARSVSDFGIPSVEADLERYSYNRSCKDKTTNPGLVECHCQTIHPTKSKVGVKINPCIQNR